MKKSKELNRILVVDYALSHFDLKIAIKILSAISEQDVFDKAEKHIHESQSYFISRTFIWSDTREGVDYWLDCHVETFK